MDNKKIAEIRDVMADIPDAPPWDGTEREDLEYRCEQLVFISKARKFVPELLDALEASEAERDKYRRYYDKCHDCPIVCGKETYLKLMNENAELITERDRLQAELEEKERRHNISVDSAAYTIKQLQAKLDAEKAGKDEAFDLVDEWEADCNQWKARAQVAESCYDALCEMAKHMGAKLRCKYCAKNDGGKCPYKASDCEDNGKVLWELDEKAWRERDND